MSSLGTDLLKSLPIFQAKVINLEKSYALKRQELKKTSGNPNARREIKKQAMAVLKELKRAKTDLRYMESKLNELKQLEKDDEEAKAKLEAEQAAIEEKARKQKSEVLTEVLKAKRMEEVNAMKVLLKEKGMEIQANKVERMEEVSFYGLDIWDVISCIWDVISCLWDVISS